MSSFCCGRQRLDVLRAGFDRRRLDVRAGIGMMRFDQADVVEEELVAAGRAELAPFLKRTRISGAVRLLLSVKHLDDDRHLVRRVAFEDDVLHHQFVVADARAFLDGAFDDVARHAGLARLFDRGRKPRIPGGIGPAELGGDHDFFDQFADELAFFQTGDFSFCMEPLATHIGWVYQLPGDSASAVARLSMLPWQGETLSSRTNGT